jgi:hypothetical protein
MSWYDFYVVLFWDYVMSLNVMDFVMSLSCHVYVIPCHLMSLIFEMGGGCVDTAIFLSISSVRLRVDGQGLRGELLPNAQENSLPVTVWWYYYGYEPFGPDGWSASATLLCWCNCNRTARYRSVALLLRCRASHVLAFYVVLDPKPNHSLA